MKKIKKAFSLIELSIVILVVGILIAGVVSSSRLVSNSKSKSAETITQSSPVSGIKGLALWLETTSKGSFNEGVRDGDDITAWNDINPQATKKLFALRSVSDSTLEYRENDSDSIGKLPSLHFSGSINQILTLCTDSNTSTISSTQIPLLTPFNAYTFFVVIKKIGGTLNGVLYNGKSSFPRDGWGSLVNSDEGPQNYVAYSGNNTFGWEPILDNVAYIMAVTYDGASSYEAYNGGSLMASGGGTLSSTSGPTSPMVIGGFSSSEAPWQGYISEIIVYDRALKKSERQAVEYYLGQKYSIKVSISG